ncbi:hypothetical protein ACHQM5_003466 [Ranunculus cassubicifolius]
MAFFSVLFSWLFGSSSVLTKEMVAKRDSATNGTQSLKLIQSQKPTSTSPIVVPHFLIGSSLSRL